MGKIVKENGVIWYEEKQHSSGIWHTYRKFMGFENESEEKPKENKKKKKDE